MAVQALAHNIFRISLPMRGAMLSEVNAYLVRGTAGDFLIDCGLPGTQTLDQISASLDDVGSGLDRLVAVIATHAHIDHAGQADLLTTTLGIPLFVHPDEEGDSAPDVARTRSWLEANRVPPDIVEEFVHRPPRRALPARVEGVIHGEELSTGDTLLQVVHTPGHTSGHICIFLQDERLLLSGDHILPSSTHVGLWTDTAGSPMTHYLESLRSVIRLAPRMILPGHGTHIVAPSERAYELLAHHDARARRILADLWLDGPGTAYGVASNLLWTSNGVALQELGLRDRTLAVSQTLAHLRALEEGGLVDVGGGEPFQYMAVDDPTRMKVVYGEASSEG